MKHLLHPIEINKACVLLSLGIRVVELKSTLQDQIYGGNFSLKDVLQGLLIDLFDILSLFG